MRGKVIFGFLLVLVFINQDNVFSAFERIGGGCARAKSLGGAFTACADDYNAVFYNPAGLIQCQSAVVSFAYELPFGIVDLKTTTAAFLFPFRYGGCGMIAQEMGNNLYKESQYILSYGKDITKDLSCGINIKFLKIGIKNYGSSSVLAIDVGGIYKITDNLKLGFFTGNCNNPCIGGKRDEIPRVDTFGISNEFLSGITLNIDIHRNGEDSMDLKCGTDILISRRFHLNLGFSDEPSIFSGGFGIELNKILFNYCISNHSRLGYTNQFSLSLSIR